LHPTLIVPPIPDKHSLSDYATAPRSAKEDVNTIDLRKRMLSVFLNRCARMKEIRADSIFSRFLDPNASWVCFGASGTAVWLLTSFRVRSCRHHPFQPSQRTTCEPHHSILPTQHLL